MSVVSFDDGGDRFAPAEFTCLPPYDWSKVPAAWRFAAPLQGTLSRQQIAAANLDRPDAVIATEHLFLKAHAKRFAGVPWLYLPHSLVVAHEIDSYGMTGIQRRLARSFYVRQQRWALRHATAVVRFNEFCAQALRDYYDERKIRAPFVINPPGMNTDQETWGQGDTKSTQDAPAPEAGLDHPANSGPSSRFVPRKDALSRSERRQWLHVLFVGRLVPSKNLSFVLRSLAAHRGASWSLDVVGDGPECTACKALATELGIEQQVQFHGHQPDPTPWYRDADLLVFPSLLESFGLVVLEAMAHGVPTLAIRGDGERYRVPFAELIDDGVNGLLARNEDDFRRRLEGAIELPQQMALLSERARQHVRDRYQWSRHLDSLEHVMRAGATKEHRKTPRESFQFQTAADH